MKRTEDKDPLDVELIDHIKNSLAAHEETYEAGAWERFAAIEEDKKPIAWIWFLRGAAAIFIVGLIALLWIFQQPNKDASQVVNTKINQKEKLKDQLTEDTSTLTIKENPQILVKQGSSETVEQQKTRRYENQQPVAHEKKVAQIQLINPSSAIAQTTIKPATADQVANSVDQDQPVNPSVKMQDQTITSVPSADSQKKLSDFLANETTKNIDKKTEKSTGKKESKFTLGLVVAPSFGNVKKLNMGYGVSVDYQLSPKFSLNSGLAYNQMSAQGTGTSGGNKSNLMMNSATSSSALFSSTNEIKKLESIEESVTGIDIPLELKYHVNKNFYANVGISAFAVISQKQNNTYVIDRAVSVIQPTNLSGYQQVSNLVVSERTIEKATSNAADYSYLGFYNLSLGYRAKISRRNSMAIEPFFKLPIQKVETQNLNLIGAGLKLKFEF